LIVKLLLDHTAPPQHPFYVDLHRAFGNNNALGLTQMLFHSLVELSKAPKHIFNREEVVRRGKVDFHQVKESKRLISHPVEASDGFAGLIKALNAMYVTSVRSLPGPEMIDFHQDIRTLRRHILSRMTQLESEIINRRWELMRQYSTTEIQNDFTYLNTPTNSHYITETRKLLQKYSTPLDELYFSANQLSSLQSMMKDEIEERNKSTNTRRSITAVLALIITVGFGAYWFRNYFRK